MWSLKFTVENKDSAYTLLTQKHAVTDFLYPADFYRTSKNTVHIMGIHLLQGDEKEQEAFANAIKKHKKTEQCERHGHMLIVLMKEEELFYDLIYDPSLYHPAPAIIQNGKETWHIASWDRKKLEKLMSTIEKTRNKFHHFELLSLQKTDLKELYFPRILPELPEQQKKAFQLALQHGYYTWPRKADLSKLAKYLGVSVSTFQEHLRKAEARLLPFFAQNLK